MARSCFGSECMRAILPLTVALAPLSIARGFLFYFDVTPKVVILLIGVAAALAWVTTERAFRRADGKTVRATLRWLYGLLAIQAASLILSTTFSSRADVSVFGSTWPRFRLITQLAPLLFTAL